VNLITKILLVSQDRQRYAHVRLAEKDREFIERANANQAVFIRPERSAYAFKHSGNAGDIIYSLPAVYALSESREAELCLDINRPMKHTAERGRHPLNGVMLNYKMFEMLRPLLLAQPGIRSCELYGSQPIDYDLDIVRKSAFSRKSGHIARWYFLCFAVTAD